MKKLISSAAAFFWNALKYSLGFLLILLFGVLGAILYALPWLLRATSVLIWFVAGYLAITGINEIYAPTTSSPIPIYALQFAVIVLLVGWATMGLLQSINKNTVWGMFALSGLLVGGFFWKFVPWVFTRWPQATDLIFRILPSVLFMVLLIAMTLRMKWLRLKGDLKLSVPTFVWMERYTPLAKKVDAVSEVDGAMK